MKYALSALALAVLVTGCPKKEPQPPPGPVENPSTRDSGTGPTERPREETGPSAGAAGPTGQGGERASLEACVDQWLKAHKLDAYGHDEGTMYTGGTPLFNEATGETRDRLDYVFGRQPDARKACVKSAQ